MKGFIFIAVAVLAAVLFAGCIAKQNETVESVGFEKSIINDAESKYPEADIIEIEGTESIGGFNATNVRVTFNYTSVCPVRMRLRYRHPAFGYETGIPTYITKDCEYRCEGSCVIASEEEAVVAAHTLDGSGLAQEFIAKNADAKARAIYDEESGVWNVAFTNAAGNETVFVNITSKNPSVISTASSAS